MLHQFYILHDNTVSIYAFTNETITIFAFKDYT